MNFRNLKLVGPLCLAAILSSCSTTGPRLVNLTPQLIPTNPSGIYTISVMVNERNMSKETPGANLVIGGNIYSMSRVPNKTNVFTFDYAIPSTGNRARYYFETLDKEGSVSGKSEVFDLRLTNRYVVELESNRAKPGVGISVLGRGFRDTDVVQFDRQSVETRFISENQLEFDVPAKEGGRDYLISLVTSGGAIPIGKFRVDFSELRSVPSRLSLLEGESFTVVFSIDQDAPPEGIQLDVRVDDYHLLEFDSARIEGGERSTNLQIIGGAPGSGNLFVKAPAHNQLVIPVTVSSRVAE